MVSPRYSHGHWLGPQLCLLFRCFIWNNLCSKHTLAPCPNSFSAIGAASCTLAELVDFMNYTNNSDPCLKFTWAISDTSHLFLDLCLVQETDYSLTLTTNPITPTFIWNTLQKRILSIALSSAPKKRLCILGH